LTRIIDTTVGSVEIVEKSPSLLTDLLRFWMFLQRFKEAPYIAMWYIEKTVDFESQLK